MASQQVFPMALLSHIHTLALLPRTTSAFAYLPHKLFIPRGPPLQQQASSTLAGDSLGPDPSFVVGSCLVHCGCQASSVLHLLYASSTTLSKWWQTKLLDISQMPLVRVCVGVGVSPHFTPPWFWITVLKWEAPEGLTQLRISKSSQIAWLKCLLNYMMINLSWTGTMNQLPKGKHVPHLTITLKSPS